MWTSTAYGPQKEGSAVIPGNKYVEIRRDAPAKKEQRDWPEHETCKFTTAAIVTDGSERGELLCICGNAQCPASAPWPVLTACRTGPIQLLEGGLAVG